MRTNALIPVAVTVAGLAATAAAVGTAGGASSPAPPTFSDPRTIDNPYMPLSKTKRCETGGENADGVKSRSVQTVLDAPRRFVIRGKAVDALVIRDEAFENGKRIEIALDYFAQDDAGTVHYLGESVQNISNGKVLDTKGTWLFGKDTDVTGVVMPANPKPDARFRAEDVPGITTESNRVEETGLRVKVGDKLYTGVLRTSEFIQPEGEVEYKLYAPGVGRIVEYDPDGRAELVGCR